MCGVGTFSGGQIFAHDDKLIIEETRFIGQVAGKQPWSRFVTMGEMVGGCRGEEQPSGRKSRSSPLFPSLSRRKWSDGRNSGRFLFWSRALSKFSECFQPFSRTLLGGLLTSSPNKVQGRSGFRSPVSQTPAALACVPLGPVTSLGNQGVLFTGRRSCQLPPQLDNPRSDQTTSCGRISLLCSGVKVPVCSNPVNWLLEDIFQLDLECFPGAANPAFPFSTTMHSLPQFLKGRRGQQTGNWCKTGTKAAKK